MFFVVQVSNAQTARDEIHANINLAGSNLLAYPGPQKSLSPAPRDKQPFYISHYGRHGSRYLCSKYEYSIPENILLKADTEGKLTDFGKDVLRRVVMVCDEADNRYGELTQLGAQQHKDIARRMYERFPQVFVDSVVVDAKSTVVIRCILSMENAMHQLLMMNPTLKVRHDASTHDMYYMNHGKDWTENFRYSAEADNLIKKWTKKNISGDRLMSKLFNDKQYIADSIKSESFMFSLFSLANIIQDCEIRHQVKLIDIFTEDEIYNLWQYNNIRWKNGYSASPFNDGLNPYTQRFLLNRIIEEADSCIALEKPGATLRYGHETMVLPLVSLLELNNSACLIENIDETAEKWQGYKFFPMACNVQIIFYRKDIYDKDILVKVLLNEDEATLPIKTDCAPYYHWNDVKLYFTAKIKDFETRTPALKDKFSKMSWVKFW